MPHLILTISMLPFFAPEMVYSPLVFCEIADLQERTFLKTERQIPLFNSKPIWLFDKTEVDVGCNLSHNSS